jgi:hypothetical protein
MIWREYQLGIHPKRIHQRQYVRTHQESKIPSLSEIVAQARLPHKSPLPTTSSTMLSAEQIAPTNVVRHVYPLGCGHLPSGRAVVNSKCVDGTPFTRTVCIRSRVQYCSLMSLLHPLLATLTSTLLHRPVDGNHHLVACNALSLSDLCSWAVCLSGPQLETSCPK